MGDDADLRRLEPFGERGDVRRHNMPPLSWSAQLRSPQDCRELDSLPAAPLLHDGLRALDLAWLTAVPRSHRAGAHAADVRRQNHDVCLIPAMVVTSRRQ